jgi:NitT/TauT family transport system substrate-binding protein
MRAADEATFLALRDGFRSGIPERWGDAERADAARLYAIMAELGGKELVGDSATLQPGTFWSEVAY